MDMGYDGENERDMGYEWSCVTPHICRERIIFFFNLSQTAAKRQIVFLAKFNGIWEIKKK